MERGRDVTETQATSDLAQQILDLEARRIDAMVRRDLIALDELLAEDLTYVHSGGRTDNKASFLALIESPDSTYLGIDYSGTEVIEAGGAAIVRGRAQIR